MQFWALWKLWNIISYMTHRGVLRKLFIRSSLRFNWMDYWELFDLSKSKSLTVFDIGSGISPDNLNTGVARYIPLFLTTHNAHCTNSLLNFLDSIQLRGWFLNKKDFEVLSVEIIETWKYSRCNVKIRAFFFWNAAIYTNLQWTAEKGENANFTSSLR